MGPTRERHARASLLPILSGDAGKSLGRGGAGIAVDVDAAFHEELPRSNALSMETAEFLGKVDAVASMRMHVLLIADDQIFPASNLQNSQASATLAEE